MKAILYYLLLGTIATTLTLSCNTKSGKSVSLDPAEFRKFRPLFGARANTTPKLPDGIYCAQIVYNYGDKYAAIAMNIPSGQYGGRWDTIQVRLRDNNVTEFIFNEESAFPVPPNPKSEYWPDGRRYRTKGDLQPSIDPSSGSTELSFLSADSTYTIDYSVKLFGSGGGCRPSKRHTPTIAENMAINDSLIAAALPYRQKQEAESAARYQEQVRQDGERDKQDREYRKRFSEQMIKENNDLQRRQNESSY